MAPGFRIGADHPEIAAARQPLMPGAGRQHRHVTGGRHGHLALVTAELYFRAAARNAQRLMNHQMIVRERMDAIAPLAVAPAVLRKQPLQLACRIVAEITATL